MKPHTPAPRRLSLREVTAVLGLPNMGKLLKYRARCQREGIAFSVMSHGGFLESDIHAFKKILDGLIAQSNHPPSSATQQPTNSSSGDRRANPDHRGDNRG